MEQRELKILRIKSLIIVSFLSKYSELEDIIKNTFQREILQIEHRHKVNCILCTDVLPFRRIMT